VEARLAAKSWLMGDHFTIADMYLFMIVNWTNFHDMDISKWPKLQEFMSRTGARSKVQEAMKAKGLVQ
jgi:glutathione S-transferase